MRQLLRVSRLHVRPRALRSFDNCTSLLSLEQLFHLASCVHIDHQLFYCCARNRRYHAYRWDVLMDLLVDLSCEFKRKAKDEER